MKKPSKEIINAEIENTTNTDLVFQEVEIENPLSPIEQAIAELKLKAYSPKKIAQTLEIPETQVKLILNRKKVKLFINEAMALVKDSLKNELIALHSKIIEDKIKEVEENYDGNFAKATKKDLPDLIKILDDLMKEEEKAKLGTNQNVFVNILQNVIDK